MRFTGIPCNLKGTINRVIIPRRHRRRAIPVAPTPCRKSTKQQVVRLEIRWLANHQYLDSWSIPYLRGADKNCLCKLSKTVIPRPYFRTSRKRRSAPCQISNHDKKSYQKSSHTAPSQQGITFVWQCIHWPWPCTHMICSGHPHTGHCGDRVVRPSVSRTVSDAAFLAFAWPLSVKIDIIISIAFS